MTEPTRKPDDFAECGVCGHDARVTRVGIVCGRCVVAAVDARRRRDALAAPSSAAPRHRRAFGWVA